MDILFLKSSHLLFIKLNLFYSYYVESILYYHKNSNHKTNLTFLIH